MSRSNKPTEKQANELWTSYTPDKEEEFWADYQTLLSNARKEVRVTVAVEKVSPPPKIKVDKARQPRPNQKRPVLPTSQPQDKIPDWLYNLLIFIVGAGIFFFFIFSPKENTSAKKSDTASQNPDPISRKVDESIKASVWGKILNLRNKGIDSLPPETGAYTYLEKVYLQNNQLTRLPKTMGHLKQMWYLDVSYNKLKHLPKEIGQCTTLKTLLLQHNRLHFLPKEIKNLRELEVLNLKGNPMASKELNKVKEWLPHCQIVF